MGRPLRVGVVHNRASGRGRASAFVARLHAFAADQARRRLVLVDLPLRLAQAADALEGLDAVVLVGGDGTIHHALPALVAAHAGRGIPTLPAPLGTENVIAGELGHRASVRAIVRALVAFADGRPPLRSDLGWVRPADVRPTRPHQAAAAADDAAEGVLFALMLSTGPDAAIVGRVAAARTGTTHKVRFVRPTLEQALRPRFHVLSVRVDGRSLATHRRGCLIVAVGPRYPLRLDLARRASRTDGLLDCLFLPASTTASALGWVAMARVGLHVRHPQARYAQGRTVELVIHDHRARPPCALQIDGEADRLPGLAGSTAGRLVITSRPAALPLILPAAETPRPMRPGPAQARLDPGPAPNAACGSPRFAEGAC
ncbi:MAG: hypothetical protein KatS3mg103_1013 [Phycisphaerales bacterium]|nr:MAG: hypothetical protein KatS3mg103_1013 [Phycisphaerales bacterium]